MILCICRQSDERTGGRCVEKKKPSESNYSRTASLATPYRPVDPIGHIVYLRTLTTGATGLFPFFSYPLFFTQMGEKVK